MSLLPGGLISKNALVRIEVLTVSKDATGKTSEAFSTLTDDVPVLITQVSASRPDEGGTTRNKITGTLTGANSALARVDVRIFVKSTSVYGLTGIYLFPESVSVHGAAGEGIMGAAPFYRVKVSTVRTT